MKVALDADVCIYGAMASPWTASVRAKLAGATLVGSALLLVEVLPTPMRSGHRQEAAALRALLRRVRLMEVSMAVAGLATEFGVELGLRAVDAVHLATAVQARADVFFTNNTRHFGTVQLPGLSVEHPVRA